MNHLISQSVAGDSKAEKNPRTFYVNQSHSNASDQGEGLKENPFRTINKAASIAAPGDTVLVYPGIYRERVSPKRGGYEGAPIKYKAVSEESDVIISGSEILSKGWARLSENNLFRIPSANIPRGCDAYKGFVDEGWVNNFNPYRSQFYPGRTARPVSKAIEELEKELDLLRMRKEANPEDPWSGVEAQKERLEKKLNTLKDRTRPWPETMGQLFCDKKPIIEASSEEECSAIPNTWVVSRCGKYLVLHLEGQLDPENVTIEASVRHTVFSPLKRGLGYIHVEGFVIQHAANWFPTWGERGWGQSGAISCRGGYHWTITKNRVQFNKSLGIDCGAQGGCESVEGVESLKIGHDETDWSKFGYHLIEDNDICDNGICGLAGIGHYGTRVLGNRIERNNREGWTSPWWESGGIKFHFVYNAVIEGNLIRDNDAHGLWLDNQWRCTRVTRNVIVNNLWSGINMEFGRGPCVIENNIIGYTRQGDGVYGHDVSEVTLRHNLIYGNSNFGVSFGYATDRVIPEDGCWDHKIVNNLILGNRAAAVSLPLPWKCAGRNRVDGNLYSGGGQYLDEGGGSNSPLFHINNACHGGPSFEADPQKPDIIWSNLIELLKKGNLAGNRWPKQEWVVEQGLLNFEQWKAALSIDLGSSVQQKVIRDGFQSRNLSWQFDFDSKLFEANCVVSETPRRDFFGHPFVDVIPGPFSDLKIGRNRLLLHIPQIFNRYQTEK